MAFKKERHSKYHPNWPCLPCILCGKSNAPQYSHYKHGKIMKNNFFGNI